MVILSTHVVRKNIGTLLNNTCVEHLSVVRTLGTWTTSLAREANRVDPITQRGVLKL